jgi:hypothetical protein
MKCAWLYRNRFVSEINRSRNNCDIYGHNECVLKILWRVDPLLGNARSIHARSNARTVFSM